LPFTNTSSYPFTRRYITRNAPYASGVYGLFSTTWVYIGETEDIQRRLLEHLVMVDPCIDRLSPTGFTYELAEEEVRIGRQNQLIAEFRPACGQKLG
jgi:hypothetical protein